MAKQNKIIKQLFSLDVSTEGTTVKGSFEIDKNAESIIGIAVSSSRDDIVFYRGTQSININGEEFFPEGYETKQLMCGINVSPNQRYYRLGNINPGNRKIDIAYTDNASDAAAFAPYRIFLYVFGKLIPEVSE
jgi:hypothetical protein